MFDFVLTINLCQNIYEIHESFENILIKIMQWINIQFNAILKSCHLLWDEYQNFSNITNNNE
jgi:hypothetical protein